MNPPEQKPRTTGAKSRGRQTPRVRTELPAKLEKNILHAGKEQHSVLISTHDFPLPRIEFNLSPHEMREASSPFSANSTRVLLITTLQSMNWGKTTKWSPGNNQHL